MELDLTPFQKNPYFQALFSVNKQLEEAKAQEASGLGELHGQKLLSEQESSKAYDALKTASMAPVETTNPFADFAQRAGAGVGDVLSNGRTQYLQTAEQRIAADREALLSKRKENLAVLGAAYEKAASRAEKLGDTELQIKHLNAAKKTQELADKLNGMMSDAAQASSAAALQTQKDAAEMDRVKLQQAAETKRQQMYVDALRDKAGVSGNGTAALKPADYNANVRNYQSQRLKTPGDLTDQNFREFLLNNRSSSQTPAQYVDALRGAKSSKKGGLMGWWGDYGSLVDPVEITNATINHFGITPEVGKAVKRMYNSLPPAGQKLYVDKVREILSPEELATLDNFTK